MNTDEHRVAIVDLADDLDVRKQRIFKLLPRLGIEPTQRRDRSRRKQLVAVVSLVEAKAIRDALDGASADESGRGATAARSTDDVGWFYLVQLEPELDPGRFKAGFTVDLDGRLQKHRCAAPYAAYAKHWPCLRAWERTAIDCVPQDAEQLHTEVYRADALARIIARAEQFFGLMPGVTEDDADSEDQS